jgi:hypothetical protein
VIAAADWVAISSIATAGATLVLALATFASVRSANRAARAAERSLLAGLRPLLVPTRPEDRPQKVGFMDDKWFVVPGNQGTVEATDEAVYLAIAVRNVGSGIAVLHGWYCDTELRRGAATHAPLEDFQRLTRDIYIAQGEAGFWQGALRDPSEPVFGIVSETIRARRPIGIQILYGDHELGQRSVSYFTLTPRDETGWYATVARHWNIDRPDPR